MVIPAPLEVEALMKQVPKGCVVTVDELRAALARKRFLVADHQKALFTKLV